MREIVKGDGVVTQRRHLPREVAHVRLDSLPLRLRLRARSFQVGEWDFRPVDPPLFISAEKWTNGIDEEQFHGEAMECGEAGRGWELGGVTGLSLKGQISNFKFQGKCLA